MENKALEKKFGKGDNKDNIEENKVENILMERPKEVPERQAAELLVKKIEGLEHEIRKSQQGFSGDTNKMLESIAKGLPPQELENLAKQAGADEALNTIDKAARVNAKVAGKKLKSLSDILKVFLAAGMINFAGGQAWAAENPVKTSMEAVLSGDNVDANFLAERLEKGESQLEENQSLPKNPDGNKKKVPGELELQVENLFKDSGQKEKGRAEEFDKKAKELFKKIAENAKKSGWLDDAGKREALKEMTKPMLRFVARRVGLDKEFNEVDFDSFVNLFANKLVDKLGEEDGKWHLEVDIGNSSKDDNRFNPDSKSKLNNSDSVGLSFEKKF